MIFYIPGSSRVKAIINHLEKCVSHSCLESFADDSKILKAVSCVEDVWTIQLSSHRIWSTYPSGLRRTVWLFMTKSLSSSATSQTRIAPFTKFPSLLRCTTTLQFYNQPLHNSQRPRIHQLRPLMAPPHQHHGWECNQDVGMSPQSLQGPLEGRHAFSLQDHGLLQTWVLLTFPVSRLYLSP